MDRLKMYPLLKRGIFIAMFVYKRVMPTSQERKAPTCRSARLCSKRCDEALVPPLQSDEGSDCNSNSRSPSRGRSRSRNGNRNRNHNDDDEDEDDDGNDNDDEADDDDDDDDDDDKW